MIRFPCSGCGKIINAADEHAGKKAKCPSCGQIVPIPQTSIAPTTAPSKPPEIPPPPRPAVKEPAAEDRVAARPTPPPAEEVLEVEEVPEVEEAEDEEERPRRRRKRTRDEGSDEPLEGYWVAIIWGSLLIPCLGGWVIVVLSSVMYYVWLKQYPVKAKTINMHGWLAWLTGQAIGVGVYFLIKALTAK